MMHRQYTIDRGPIITGLLAVLAAPVWLLALAVSRLLIPRSERARVVVSSPDGRVLLVRNMLNPFAWSLPGGGAHRGEPMKAAAIREVAEELGIDIRQDDIKHLLHINGRDHALANDYDVYEYHWRVSDGYPKISYELLMAQWFSVDQLPDTADRVAHMSVASFTKK